MSRPQIHTLSQNFNPKRTDGGEGWNGNIRRKSMEGDEREGAALGMFNPNGRVGEASASRRYTKNGSTDFAALPGPRGGPPNGRWPANVCHDGGDEVMEAFAVYGDAGSIARFFYCAKADGEDRWGSRHPTVKPVELLKWLVPLVTPKGGTFLDPFAGSGTAAVAALATDRNAILIEREPGYCADIRERIAHYEGQGRHSLASKARNRQCETVGSLL